MGKKQLRQLTSNIQHVQLPETQIKFEHLDPGFTKGQLSDQSGSRHGGWSKDRAAPNGMPAKPFVVGMAKKASILGPPVENTLFSVVYFGRGILPKKK